MSVDIPLNHDVIAAAIDNLASQNPLYRTPTSTFKRQKRMMGPNSTMAGATPSNITTASALNSTTVDLKPPYTPIATPKQPFASPATFASNVSASTSFTLATPTPSSMLKSTPVTSALLTPSSMALSFSEEYDGTTDLPPTVNVELIRPNGTENDHSNRPFRYMYMHENAIRNMLETRLTSMSTALMKTVQFERVVNGMKLDRRRERAPTDREKERSIEGTADPSTAPIKVEEEEEDIDFVSVTTRSSNPMLVQGIITSSWDLDEKSLTNLSIQLKGSEADSQSKRISLALGKLPYYSLFTGQCVVMKGTNASGTKLVVDDIVHEAPLPPILMDVNKLDQFSNDVSIISAAGPFSPSDTWGSPLSHSTTRVSEEFHALMKIVEEKKPNVLILMGPFLDIDNEILTKSPPDTYENIFKGMLELVFSTCKSCSPHTHIIIQPSSRDIHHMPIFPQMPYSLPTHTLSYPYLSLVPNPATIRINDFTIGMSSMDVISHFCKSTSSLQKLDPAVSISKFPSIARHLITQRSFYPLYPPAENACVDLTHSTRYHMPCTPDILILPSIFANFVSAIGDDLPTMAINHGTLCKGKSKGTYAYMTVRALNSAEITEYKINAVKGKVRNYEGLRNRLKVESSRI